MIDRAFKEKETLSWVLGEGVIMDSDIIAETAIMSTLSVANPPSNEFSRIFTYLYVYFAYVIFVGLCDRLTIL